MASFNSLSHNLIDAWVAAEVIADPKDLYGPILNSMNIKMALSLIDMSGEDPYDWNFTRIKNYGFKSSLMIWETYFPNGPLRNLDRAYVDEAIIPAVSHMRKIRRPAIEHIRSKIAGIRFGYDRVILPQKGDGVPSWCISMAEGRFMLPRPREEKMDLVDEGIVQLLIEGHTAKEIADLLALSPRTVEHRIEKMKDRLGARNLVHLVAKLVGQQVSGTTSGSQLVSDL